jgi:WD40 repeat protein/tRNA A-37 threonylcarbamoyl transferase component Bud32
MNDAEEHLMTVFSAALERGSAAGRQAYLDRACADDPPLRHRIEALLRAHDRAGGFLGREHARAPGHKASDLRVVPGELPISDPSDAHAATGADDAPPEGRHRMAPVIPGYEIAGELGRGGMGVVYKARQTRLNRPVALKMILAGAHAGAEATARFLAEAEAVAQLQHPNIVQIFHIDEHAGHPYFEMEFVGGGSLAERLDGTPRPPREASRLTEILARAMAEAHRRGIVHRDLKPGNILLTPEGAPKVADFGLAKLLDAESGLTQTDSILGSPSYMAPEQAGGKAKEVGPAADVYALGAILYELLTGRPPFRGATMLETLEQVKTTDPVPPSRLAPGMPRDAETIALKCLQKDPSRRYESAGALAEDLRRYQAGEPIVARPVGSAERAWRWCRRYPVVASLVSTVAALVIALAIGSTAAAIWLGQSRAEVKAKLKQIQEAEAQKTEQLWGAELARARAGRLSHRVGQRFESLAALRRAADLDVFPQRRPELRNEAIACLALPDVRRELDLGIRIDDEVADAYWMAFDGAFEHYAYVDRQGAVVLRRVNDGTELGRRPGPGRRSGWVVLQFSPDGRWLVIEDHPEFRGHAGAILAWKVGTGKPGGVVTLSEGGARWSGFSPDGRTGILHEWQIDSVALVDLASGRRSHRVRLDLASGGQFRQGSLWASPDSRQAAVVEARAVYLFDLGTGAEVHRLDHPENVDAVAWNRDSRLLAVGCQDRQIYVWEAASWRLISVLEGHQGGAVEPFFSHSGDFLASRCWDTTSRLWDPIQGRERLSIPGFLVALSDDDRRVALVAPSGQLEVWELDSGRACRTLHPGRVGNRSPRLNHALFEVDFLRDGRVLACASGGVGLRLWDLAAFAEVAYFPIGHCSTARFRPDGTSLLTYSSGLRLWPIRTEPGAGGDTLRFGPARLADLPRRANEATADWDETGRFVTAVEPVRDQAVLLDPATLAEVARFGPHRRLRYARVSPDGRWLATSTWHGSNVRVWDVGRHTVAWELPCGSAIAAFSPDGRWLVTAFGHAYRLWHVGSWQPGVAIRLDNFFLGNFAFARDGRLLAVDRGGLVLLVDPESGRELAILEPPPEAPRGPIWRLAFSHDGGRLAVPVGDEILVWDLRRIRAGLAALGLDWDAPAIPTPDPVDAAAPPLRVHVEGADWFASAYEGSDHGQERQWGAATAAYARAIAQGADDPIIWRRDAVIRLRAGDHKGYRADCADLLAHFGRDDRSEVIIDVAGACALGPDAPADWPALVRSVQAAVARDPGDPRRQNALGAVLVRAGQPEAAIPALEESIRLNGHGGNAYDWLFLAMARHRLGRAEEAKAALETARDWIAHGDERAVPEPYIMSPLNWSTRLELEVLAREAEALITRPSTALPADVFAP